MKLKHKGCLGVAFGLPLMAWVLFSVVFHTSEPIIEKNLAAVDWLPPYASDVSYFERKGFGWVKFYECSMSESNFLDFAKQNAWRIEERENISVDDRYILGEPPPGGIHDVETGQVLKALVFKDRKPNGGGITVVYDKEMNRLFVSSSHR